MIRKHNLPDAPRYQPCPICNKSCKRVSKTAGGAYYQCPVHHKFFVRRAGGAIVRK